MKAQDALDHLLLGIADLDLGIRWIKEMTGVEAVVGGSHPGAGTRNALISLGNRQYIEIIAIDPGQTELSRTASLIQNLSIPKLITWAASTSDIKALAREAQSAGYDIEGPSEGSRIKPAGSMLQWQTVRIISRFGDVIPFFIRWDPASVHPSDDSPSGCRLDEFSIEHPDSEGVSQTLRALSIETRVSSRHEPVLRAVLATPKGKLELS